jgi:hypothetical protein
MTFQSLDRSSVDRGVRPGQCMAACSQAIRITVDQRIAVGVVMVVMLPVPFAAAFKA